jgi:hypothetical protein
MLRGNPVSARVLQPDNSERCLQAHAFTMIPLTPGRRSSGIFFVKSHPACMRRHPVGAVVFTMRADGAKNVIGSRHFRFHGQPQTEVMEFTEQLMLIEAADFMHKVAFDKNRGHCNRYVQSQ